MTLYKNKYRVETTRLKGWDYSQDGYYFVTVCTHNMECLFGEIVDNKMILNRYGIIVNNCWLDLPYHYHNMKLDAFCIMPNHIHCIIIINNNRMDIDTGFGDMGFVETGFKPVSTINTNASTNPNPIPRTTSKRHGLFEFIRALKTFSARRINELRNSAGTKIWQIRFYDHIIRDDVSLHMIRQYIIFNPKSWGKDKFYK